MQLSEHFTLEEFTRSETAARKGLDNSAPSEILDRLTLTAEKMEQVRGILGDAPITVFSGYRSPVVNRAVGGARSSAHMKGYAVDFKARNFSVAEAIKLIRQSPLRFDQLIDEFGAWVHISFDPLPMRRQVLAARKVNGKTVYLNI